MKLMFRNLLSAVALATITSAITIGNALPVTALTLAPNRRIDLATGRFLSGFLETNALGELTYSVNVSEIQTPEFLFPAITYDSSMALDSFEITDDNTLILLKESPDLDPTLTDMLKFSFREGLEEAFTSGRDRGNPPPWWRIIWGYEVSPIDEPHSFLGLLVLGAFGAGTILKKQLASSKKRDR